MNSDFIFPNNDTISDQITIQKEVAKNVMKQKSQQVDLNLIIEYCNYSSKITLLLSLDIMDHKTQSIHKTKSLVGIDSISNSVVVIVLVHLLLNTK